MCFSSCSAAALVVSIAPSKERCDNDEVWALGGELRCARSLTGQPGVAAGVVIGSVTPGIVLPASRAALLRQSEIIRPCRSQ